MLASLLGPGLPLHLTLPALSLAAAIISPVLHLATWGCTDMPKPAIGVVCAPSLIP